MFTDKDEEKHLIHILKQHYPTVTTDWKGDLYCGFHLKWNYQQSYIDIYMPKYIPQILQRFQNATPHKTQYTPYTWTPTIYGMHDQDRIPPDTSEPLTVLGKL